MNYTKLAVVTEGQRIKLAKALNAVSSDIQVSFSKDGTIKVTEELQDKRWLVYKKDLVQGRFEYVLVEIDDEGNSDNEEDIFTSFAHLIESLKKEIRDNH